MLRRETALPETHGSFRLLFENNPLPMWVYDLESLHFLEVNSVAIAQYGYTRDEFLAMRIADIRPQEDVPRLLADVSTERSPFQASGEWRHRRKNGEIIDVQIVSHTLLFHGRRAALVVAQDITQRRRTEERIHLQLKRLGALRAIDMAITASLDLRVTLNVLLDQVITHLAVDAAEVLILNLHSQVLECAAWRGFRSSDINRVPVRLGQGHAGRAAFDRTIVTVANLSETPGAFARSVDLVSEGLQTYYAVPLVAKGQVKGVLEVFFRRVCTPDQEWLDFLDALAGQAAIAIDNATLFDDLQRSNMGLSIAYDTTIEGWSRALDLRDKETEGHSERVTDLTVRLARAMNVPDADLVHIRRGALLHDIGKMGIPDRILHKPEPLMEDERALMQQHPDFAYALLSPIPYLRPALDIPYCHHEKWDGTGYPRGLKGEQIPLSARIFAVADVWDALRSDRPYRPAWTKDRTLEYHRQQAGAHFDPSVVDIFLRLEAEERERNQTPSGSPRPESRGDK